MKTLRLASGRDLIALHHASSIERLLAAPSRPHPVASVLVDLPPDEAPAMAALAEELHGGRADAAVVPAVWLHAGIPEGLALGAIAREGDPRYRCVARSRPILARLPAGSAVAAEDSVALAQIRFRYPRLRVEPLADPAAIFDDLRHGRWDAVVVSLARAAVGALWGLEAAPIEPAEILPVVGQGVVALLVAPGTEAGAPAAIDDPHARVCLRAESVFVRRASQVPGSLATAIATLLVDTLDVEGLIVDAGGAWIAADGAQAPVRYAGIIAREVAESCTETAWQRRAERAVAVAAVAS